MLSTAVPVPLLVEHCPPPPRKPRPLTSMVWPPQLSWPATSKATMPPVAPSQGGAVTVPVSVALEYCGTRITWKRRWPWPALAAACV